MKVERYEPRIHGGHAELIHHEGDEGKYVLFSAYEQLEKADVENLNMWREEREAREQLEKERDGFDYARTLAYELWQTEKARAEAAETELKAFLSAFKIWRNATASRCRMLSSRESSDAMLKPDRDFIAAVEGLLKEGAAVE